MGRRGGHRKDDRLIINFSRMVDDCSLMDIGFIGTLLRGATGGQMVKLFLKG